MKLKIFSTLKIQSWQRAYRFFVLVSIFSIHIVYSFAFAIDSHRCEGIYDSNYSKKEIQSSLESLWKLHVDKQIAIVEANNTNALASTREKAARLEQTYKKNISEAQGNIPDFKTVWNEFIKQKMQQQSRSAQQNAAEKSYREKANLQEERSRLEDAHDPNKIARKPIFHIIPPGKFLMGVEKVPTEITQAFSMMDTHVTQLMWARLKILMGETDSELINPSVFSDGSKSVVVKVENEVLHIQPNHPVENISNIDFFKDPEGISKASEFITGLNNLSKNGDVQIQEKLKEIIPDHQKGDHYDLPTEAQWEYVMSNLGKVHYIHFNKDNDKGLKKYAWYDYKNGSDYGWQGRTHRVASKKPRKIDLELLFYDLEGNVGDLTKDQWDGVSPLPGGKDPIGTEGEYLVARGGSWIHSSGQLNIYHRWAVHRYSGYHTVGIRLIRVRL